MSGLVENQNPDNSSDQTQQTNEQENQHTDEGTDLRNYVNSLEARLAAQQIYNRKLETRLESIESRPAPEAPKPARNVEESAKRYFTDPETVIDERLDVKVEKLYERIEKSLEPIKRVAQRLTANDEYTELKHTVSADPIFRKALADPDVAAVVDRMMNTPGTAMTEANLKMAIASTSFSKQNGMLGNRRIENNNENRRVETEYLPPSNRRKDPPTKQKELSEDDRLAMRIGGITDPEEYWKLMADDKMVLPTDKPRKDARK